MTESAARLFQPFRNAKKVTHAEYLIKVKCVNYRDGQIPQFLHEVHVLMGHQVIEKPLQAPIKHINTWIMPRRKPPEVTHNVGKKTKTDFFVTESRPYMLAAA